MTKKRADKGKRDSALDAPDLSRAYRAGTEEQPPPHLDAAILSQARKAVGVSSGFSPFRGGWSAPLSAAAVVVLSVVLVLFMARETPLQERAASQDATLEHRPVEKTEHFARRDQDNVPRLEPLPSAPQPVDNATAQNKPAQEDKFAKKKESEINITTAAPAAVPASPPARERVNESVGAIASSPDAGSGNRSARLMAKQGAARAIDLQVGKSVIQAELASTAAEVQRGLMFRDSLAPNTGMLFIFPPRRPSVCMWMRNTKIPLSAAFIDRNGIVLNIADMQPHSETVHCAEGEARYVLELNQGTFTAAGVKPGIRIGGLPPLTD